MRGAEPCVPRTPGVELAQKEPRAWVPAAAGLEAPGAVGHSRFPWPRGGARAPGGGLTGVGRSRCAHGARRAGETGTAGGQGWGRGRRRRRQRSREVEKNQGWQPYLRIPERSVPGLKLIFDPSRDLCLKLAAARFLAEQTWPWDREGWDSPRVG